MIKRLTLIVAKGNTLVQPKSVIKRIFHMWLDITNFGIDICEDKVPILHICEHLVLILHIYENWVPILHRFEELVPILHICENWVPILHIWEKSTLSFAYGTNAYQFFTVKKKWEMWNLRTDVRPPKLSNLTIRKFHIFQKWRSGTNSLHGVKFAKCEICGSTKLSKPRSYTTWRGVKSEVPLFAYTFDLTYRMIY